MLRQVGVIRAQELPPVQRWIEIQVRAARASACPEWTSNIPVKPVISKTSLTEDCTAQSANMPLAAFTRLSTESTTRKPALETTSAMVDAPGDAGGLPNSRIARLLVLRAGADAALRPKDQPGQRWSRAW